MDIKNLKQNFSQAELLAVKKFLAYVNDEAQKNSDFADDASLDALNQFSAIAETDADIRTNVKEWLRMKKIRLRGNFTNN